MDPDAILGILQGALPDASIERAVSIDLQPTLYIPAAAIVTAMRTLRDRPELRFAVLAEVTATDYWPREPRFELTYILLSVEHRLRLRIKVRLAGDAAHVSTMTAIWPSANWLEREVWDLFGIVFDGHPDPRRLLMPEDWDGFPLRKDYPVQIKMTPRASEALQVTEQEFKANLERDRLTRG